MSCHSTPQSAQLKANIVKGCHDTFAVSSGPSTLPDDQPANFRSCIRVRITSSSCITSCQAPFGRAESSQNKNSNPETPSFQVRFLRRTLHSRVPRPATACPRHSQDVLRAAAAPPGGAEGVQAPLLVGAYMGDCGVRVAKRAQQEGTQSDAVRKEPQPQVRSTGASGDISELL
jgi:hypothetical protein